MTGKKYPSTLPAAIAVGDQLHAEVTARAIADVAAMARAENLTPNEDEQLYVEIGIQAGYVAALRAVADRGWLLVKL